MTADADDPVVRLASELVARASENPPGNERTVVEWLESRLAESSAPFEITTTEVLPDRPNVVARLGDPANGSVLLTGHTDVVPANEADWTTGPYDPTVRDGRLFGRGTADMKGALAGMVVAAERYFEHADDPGEVILAFVVDEEHGGSGMQALVEGGFEADVAIVGEPTEMNVCTAIKGVARYEARIHGESCHSGQPDEGRDAIRGLDELLTRVRSLDESLQSTAHPVLSHEDVTVTEVAGGIAPNVVADRAEATIDWRFLPGTIEPGPFDERLSDAVGTLRVDGSELDLNLERTVFARAGEIDNDHALVSTVLDVGQANGAESELVGFDAATDARFLIHDAEIPTVHFGPGSLTEDAHTVDESVSVDELTTATDVYCDVLDRLL